MLDEQKPKSIVFAGFGNKTELGDDPIHDIPLWEGPFAMVPFVQVQGVLGRFGLQDEIMLLNSSATI